jgi:hypothetical protein
LGYIFDGVQACVECLLCFVWRDVADAAVQACLVMPIDLLQGFPLDLANRFPSAKELDVLGIEQTEDAFDKGVVVGIPDAADRGVDASLGQPPGVSDRQVLGRFNRSSQRLPSYPV